MCGQWKTFKWSETKKKKEINDYQFTALIIQGCIRVVSRNDLQSLHSLKREILILTRSRKGQERVNASLLAKEMKTRKIFFQRLGQTLVTPIFNVFLSNSNQKSLILIIDLLPYLLNVIIVIIHILYKI